LETDMTYEQGSYPSGDFRAGGCHCGAVRYTVQGALRDVVLCHCRICRRLHGHVGAYTACSLEQLVVRPSSELCWYSSSAQARRGFCGRCGAQLFWAPTDRPSISLAIGSLDDTRGLRTSQHICVAQKGDYYEIMDGLPQQP
jgi:hypothetical protein